MAIYYCDTKPIGRSKGRSAVAASAYRAGDKLEDERTGITHDYTRRSGVVRAFAFLPNGERCDRNELWNAAEAAEKRKDARTAREWVLALPAELNNKQRLLLATEFGLELSQRYGVAVDIAIHSPGERGDQRNHHAHVMTTTRKVTLQQGKLTLGDKTTLELSDKKRGELKLGRAREDIKNLRSRWADLANERLMREGHEARIDHRSLQEQGIERVPTVHLGHAATAMERRGIKTHLGDHNRQVKQLEHELIQLKTQQKERDKQQLEATIQAGKNHFRKRYEGYQQQRAFEFNLQQEQERKRERQREIERAGPAFDPPRQRKRDRGLER